MNQQEQNICHQVSFLRHSGWIGPEELTEPLNIIGCGAVGSNAALLAGKMGFHKFNLWDADHVEPHNLSNQAYDIQHVGQLKVKSLQHVLKRFNPAIEVNTFNKFFFTEEDKKHLCGPLIVATDSMSSRQDIYDAFYMNTQISGVFEVRLGFDYGECNIIDNTNPIQCLSWKDTLVDDSEVPDGPCNLRMCTTLVQLVCSYAVHSICSRYVAAKQNDIWSYSPKTMFSLTDRLNINSIK